MEIQFRSARVERLFNSSKLLNGKYGDGMTKKIMLRLAALRNAETLADYRAYDQRCHELKENRKGQIAVDLVHPFRLVFEPLIHPDAPPPTKSDGGYDWTKITGIIILEIVDYH